MGDGTIEADAVARPQAVHHVAQMDLGHSLQNEPALLGMVGEGFLARSRADLVLAQDELDVSGEVGREQLVRDAAPRGQALALVRPDHRAVEKSGLRHEAADGRAEGGGDGLQGGDGRIELIALELTERADAHPDLLRHLAEGQLVPEACGADPLSEAGGPRHGRTLSSVTEKVK